MPSKWSHLLRNATCSCLVHSVLSQSFLFFLKLDLTQGHVPSQDSSYPTTGRVVGPQAQLPLKGPLSCGKYHDLRHLLTALQVKASPFLVPSTCLWPFQI